MTLHAVFTKPHASEQTAGTSHCPTCVGEVACIQAVPRLCKHVGRQLMTVTVLRPFAGIWSSNPQLRFNAQIYTGSFTVVMAVLWWLYWSLYQSNPGYLPIRGQQGTGQRQCQYCGCMQPLRSKHDHRSGISCCRTPMHGFVSFSMGLRGALATIPMSTSSCPVHMHPVLSEHDLLISLLQDAVSAQSPMNLQLAIQLDQQPRCKELQLAASLSLLESHGQVNHVPMQGQQLILELLGRWQGGQNKPQGSWLGCPCSLQGCHTDTMNLCWKAGEKAASYQV